jgi:hypothetical protein
MMELLQNPSELKLLAIAQKKVFPLSLSFKSIARVQLDILTQIRDQIDYQTPQIRLESTSDVHSRNDLFMDSFSHASESDSSSSLSSEDSDHVFYSAH